MILRNPESSLLCQMPAEQAVEQKNTACCMGGQTGKINPNFPSSRNTGSNWYRQPANSAGRGISKDQESLIPDYRDTSGVGRIAVSRGNESGNSR
jgi:hypothetical protein